MVAASAASPVVNFVMVVPPCAEDYEAARAGEIRPKHVWVAWQLRPMANFGQGARFRSLQRLCGGLQEEASRQVFFREENT
jgi:hypothetical protein